MAKSEHVFKILVIGDPGVGKSSLLLRFTDSTFSDATPSSLDEDAKTRIIDVSGKKITLEVWDTQGQERFRTITSSYYRGSAGLLIVFDVSEQASFEKIPQWVSEADRYAKDTKRILVGNKADLSSESKQIIQRSVAEKVAKEHKLEYFEVSAKTGQNVVEVFNRLGALCLEKVLALDPAAQQEAKSAGGGSFPMNTVVLKDGAAKEKKSGGCFIL